jgi:ribonuclease P protein component
MIAKSFRLPKNDIKHILRKGFTVHSRFFIIKTFNSENENPRASVITSKKLAKKATTRNKIRRRTYEAFRLLVKENKIPQKKDFIFIAKTGILEKDFWQIKKDLNLSLTNEQTK